MDALVAQGLGRDDGACGIGGEEGAEVVASTSELGAAAFVAVEDGQDHGDGVTGVLHSVYGVKEARSGRAGIIHDGDGGARGEFGGWAFDRALAAVSLRLFAND